MKKLNKISFIILIYFVCSTLIFSNEQIRNWTEKYDDLLKKYVSKGMINNIALHVVDYKSLAKDQNLYNLNEKLKEIKSVENLSKNDKIAFWINVYNYLTLLKVAENPDIKSIKDLNKLFKTVWQQPAGVVSGNQVTLDYIEHEILRKQLKEPLIHFAIVCASVSCPDLRMEAYTGTNLYNQLIDQAKAFLNNDKKGLKINEEKKIITLSKIFSWFKTDFDDPVEYLIKNDYLDQKYKDYRLNYFDYDWNLNS